MYQTCKTDMVCVFRVYILGSNGGIINVILIINIINHYMYIFPIKF